MESFGYQAKGSAERKQGRPSLSPPNSQLPAEERGTTIKEDEAWRDMQKSDHS